MVTRIGIDIGGTFTDFVMLDPASGQVQTFKLLSTPADPAEAVLAGLERIRQDVKGETWIIHGSTVATNAILERKGAPTAFIATRGFRDILQIGRQNRPALYDLAVEPTPPLVPEQLRFEVDERVDHKGRVLIELQAEQVDELIESLHVKGLDPQHLPSIAVCLLFSFLYPQHELLISEKLQAAGYFVSPSCEILPEYREYERASTTAVNAYVTPVLNRYLSHLEAAFSFGGPEDKREEITGKQEKQESTTNLRVMQSNGGIISLKEASRAGVRCVLSGPAGGIVGARFIAQLAQGGHPRIITFDMGGTSTDVSLVDGEPRLTSDSQVGGYPIHIPVLDIHTIGAGGGSIAVADAGGALRVGPESAGADPGPACYGRGGDLATVTDANLVLGRLEPDYFLGGEMTLEVEKARQAVQLLGDSLGLSPIKAALGVVEVANAHMERALRVISIERGHNPQDFTLLTFGGAGGLHAADLARRLSIPQVIVPPLASTLSAFGMLAADVVKDYTQTLMLPDQTPTEEIEARLKPLQQRAYEDLLGEGVAPADMLLEPFLDLRYRGQSYELTVPFSQQVREAFQAAHRLAYGYDRPGAALEIVNGRVRATGKVTTPRLTPQPLGEADPRPAYLATRPVFFQSAKGEPLNLPTPLYRSENLLPGNILSGPTLVVRADTTILLSPGDQATVDGYSNLVIKVSRWDANESGE